jgi:3-oxoadipate enol-lactonase
MPFVTHDGARLHWNSQGSGTPVLLIMGHRYDSSMWYPLVPRLAERHRVITFDNRGTGRTDTTSDVTIEQLAADALAVLDAAGEEEAHVYGVSMGGAIAAELGMTRPERVLSLTLGCTMLKTETTSRSLLVRAVYRLPAWLSRRLMHALSTSKSYGSSAPAAWVARDRAAMGDSAFTAKGVREQSKAIACYATTVERAAKLAMPILILHGDEDSVVPVRHGRALATLLPRSSYREFSGAGHNYLVATGGGSNTAFVDFIDAVDVCNSTPKGRIA